MNILFIKSFNKRRKKKKSIISCKLYFSKNKKKSKKFKILFSKNKKKYAFTFKTSFKNRCWS